MLVELSNIAASWEAFLSELTWILSVLSFISSALLFIAKSCTACWESISALVYQSPLPPPLPSMSVKSAMVPYLVGVAIIVPAGASASDTILVLPKWILFDDIL